MIYLDHNATTPIDPEVSDAIFSALKRDFGNPSSGHAVGRKAKELLDASRAIIADFLGCGPDEIFFTSGGTEANNLAILGRAFHARKGHIITSAVEHPSVLAPCRHLMKRGFTLTEIPANGDGIVDIDILRKSIRKDTCLISIMHANNETGVLQPVEEIGILARERQIPFHVDAAQSIGKMHFSLTKDCVDFLTVVPHKFYGPKGTGCLFIRNKVAVSPLVFGAGHEKGLRPGTENIPGIVGFAKACQIAQRDIKLRVTHTTALRTLLLELLQKQYPGISLNGHPTLRLPNTLNIMIPGIQAADLLSRIGDRVAASAGSACHAGHTSPSPTLTAMGVTDENALSSVRLSVGKDNTEDEIRQAADIIFSALEDMTAPPKSD